MRDGLGAFVGPRISAFRKTPGHTSHAYRTILRNRLSCPISKSYCARYLRMRCENAGAERNTPAVMRAKSLDARGKRPRERFPPRDAMPLQRIRGSERTREGGEHGQAEYDAPRVHEAGSRHRCRSCRGCAYGCRAGRVEQRHPKQGGRDQARAFLLPRLRQDGMRRVGHRRERPRHPHGRRRERVPFHGQPLRQGSGVAAGGVPSRPLVPSHEAHERPRRGRSRLGAHQLGRGDEHHRREAAGDDGPLWRRVHLRHVGHQPHLGHVRIRRTRPAGRQPEHVHSVAGVQGPALLRHRAELHDAGIVDGDGRPPEGVHVLGHRPGAFELR